MNKCPHCGQEPAKINAPTPDDGLVRAEVRATVEKIVWGFNAEAPLILSDRAKLVEQLMATLAASSTSAKPEDTKRFDYDQAADAAQHILDYADVNLTMFDAIGEGTPTKAIAMYEAAKALVAVMPRNTSNTKE